MIAYTQVRACSLATAGFVFSAYIVATVSLQCIHMLHRDIGATQQYFSNPSVSVIVE